MTCVSSMGCAGPYAAVQDQLQAFHAAPSLHRATLAIEVRDAEHNAIVFQENANKLLVPASTLKLVTAIAAIDRLGLAHRFETRLVTTATITKGVLAGDLIIMGGGDPSLGIIGEPLLDLANQLRALGVHKIAGDIIADDGLIADGPLGAGWAWDDAAFSYSAPISALSFEHNITNATIAPEYVIADADCLPLETAIQAITSKEKTGPDEKAGPGEKPKLEVMRRGSQTLLFGTVLKNEAPRLTLTVPEPARCFVRRLKNALEKAGIHVLGQTKVRAKTFDQYTPLDAPVLARYRSPTLEALLTTMLKKSQNLYAELIARQLDPSQEKTFQGALEIIEATLSKAGVPKDAYRIYDGSGLSRYNLMSAEALVLLLSWAAKQPWADAFVAMLPTSGADGTLVRRMTVSPAKGRVHAKTGSMTAVYALAGYLTTSKGETLVFSMLSNGASQGGQVMRGFQDRILELLTAGTW